MGPAAAGVAMGVFFTVLLVLIVLAAAFATVCVIAAVLDERRQRRLALQRALVIQCAEQRMRSASQQALGAMLSVVDQRFDRQ